MEKSYKLSIVVPVYNEELVLPELFDRLTKSADSWKCDWEVICVDDGSRDKTFDLLKNHHSKDPRWKTISFSRNFGHQTAVSCGLYHATGDAVFVIDADLQDPPEELSRFIKKWEEGYHVVYAIRTQRKESGLKKFSYWAFYRILHKMSDFKIPLDSGDFSLMDKKVVSVLNSLPERKRYVRGLRAWAGFKQIGIEYERAARAKGETKYSLKKLFELAGNGILSFSAFPLIIAAYLGAAVFVISILGVIFTLLQRLFSGFFWSIGIGPVPGYATTVIIVLFLGGMQLFFLGVIGMYLNRVYEEVKGRPSWIINELLGLEKK